MSEQNKEFKKFKELLEEMENNIKNKKDNQYLIEKIKNADPVLLMAFMHKLYIHRKKLIEIVKEISNERLKHYDKKLKRYVDKGKLARHQKNKFSNWLKQIKEMEAELDTRIGK